MPFVDQTKIILEAGSGGQGSNGVYWDRRLRHPKPDGGKGGKGGDVIIIAQKKLHTLLDFRYNHHFRAKHGARGGSQRKQGKSGEDCVVEVPVGTIVYELPERNIVRDLKFDAEQVIIARGGSGGKGNALVDVATVGKPGEIREIFLELRLIADAGIIGFPNAGKSTLISQVSNATPKIADYPFTTKSPILGIVQKEDYSITVADLPGIIEGAHEGKGLGLEFLRHAQRTRFLIHLIDMAAMDGRNPADDYNILNNELKFYSRELMLKPQIIVANKMDVPQAKSNLELFKKSVKKKIYPISALNKQGLDELLKVIVRNYEKTISHNH